MNAVTKFVPVVIAALMGNTAYAADGTINVKGKLVGSTCTIAVNGVVSPAATVILPTVSTSVLDAAGKVAGRTTFNIELINCDLDSSSYGANAFFEAGADVDPISGHLINRGDATNVRLQLLTQRNLTGEFRPIKVGDPSQRSFNYAAKFNPPPPRVAPRIAPTLPGPYLLYHAVEYIATAPTTEGSVLSAVTYSINYF